MRERSFKDYFRFFKRDVTQFVELKLEYYKLEFVDVFSTIFSRLISVVVSLIIGVIFLTFILIGVGFYLGKLLGGYHWGFFIVAGIFFILAMIFLLFRNKILTNPLINVLIASLFEEQIKKENKQEYASKNKKKKH